jgi:hypothetical protein
MNTPVGRAPFGFPTTVLGAVGSGAAAGWGIGRAIDNASGGRISGAAGDFAFKNAGPASPGMIRVGDALGRVAPNLFHL